MHSSTVDGVRARESATATGIALALVAHGFWGTLPLYWHALSALPVGELLAHRVWMSALFGIALLAITGTWREARDAIGSLRGLGVLVTTSALIGLNWSLFIWTVHRGDVIASSLGYFLNPIVTVALGVAVLGERLRPLQALAVLIAGAGVLSLALRAGGLPWVSLALASSFAVYALLRKLVPVGPVVALALEASFLAPIALAVLGWLHAHGLARTASLAPAELALLAGAGVVTGIPLLCFTAAAGRLRLSTLGLFQYLGPTLQLAIAVGLFGEPFDRARATAFVCVWAALALYSVDSLRAYGGSLPPRPPSEGAPGPV